ncbi:MAG: sulfur carrier protein ThiS [Myxococcota bacterium]|nr:sulfur carrier protein ThiS [Myxococcota bacterium]MEC8380656.1 sulfur carrier protein ThiS [Myxococcota bacterium]
MIQVLLNGSTIQTQVGTTLLAFLRTHFGTNLNGVAVALNGSLARRSGWAETTLQKNDELEVLHAVAGG